MISPDAINRAAGAANPLARDTAFLAAEGGADSGNGGGADSDYFEGHFSTSDSNSRSCTHIIAQRRHRGDDADDEEAQKGGADHHMHSHNKERYASQKRLLTDEDRARTVPAPHTQHHSDSRQHFAPHSVGNFGAGAADCEFSDTDCEDADADADAERSVYMAPATPIVAREKSRGGGAGGHKLATARRLDFDDVATADTDPMVMATPNVGPRDAPPHLHAPNDSNFDGFLAPPARPSSRGPSSPGPDTHLSNVQTHNSRTNEVYYDSPPPHHHHEPFVNFHTHTTTVADWPRDMSPLSDLSVLACATSRYHNEVFAHDQDSLIHRRHNNGGCDVPPPPLIDDHANSFYDSEFHQMAFDHRNMPTDEDRVFVGNPGHNLRSALQAHAHDTYHFDSGLHDENMPPPPSPFKHCSSSRYSTPEPPHVLERKRLQRTSSKKQRSTHKQRKTRSSKHRRSKRRTDGGDGIGIKSRVRRRRRRRDKADAANRSHAQADVEASASPLEPGTDADRRVPMLDDSSKTSAASLRSPHAHKSSWWRKLFHRVLCVGVMCPPPNEKENRSERGGIHRSTGTTPAPAVAPQTPKQPKQPSSSNYTPSHQRSLITSVRAYSPPPFDLRHDARAAPPNPFGGERVQRLSSLSQLKPLPEKFPRYTPTDIQVAFPSHHRPLSPEHESRSFYAYGGNHDDFATPQKRPVYSPPPLLQPTPIHAARVRSLAPVTPKRDTTTATAATENVVPMSPVERDFTHDVSHLPRVCTPEPRDFAQLPSPVRRTSIILLAAEGVPPMHDDEFPVHCSPVKALSECGSDLPLPLAHHHALASPVVHFRTPAVVRVGGPCVLSGHNNQSRSMTAPRPIRPTPLRPAAIPFDAFAMSDTESEASLHSPSHSSAASARSMVTDLEHYVDTHPGMLDEHADAGGEESPGMPTRRHEEHADSSNNLHEINEFLGLLPSQNHEHDMPSRVVGAHTLPHEHDPPHDIPSRFGVRTPPHMAMRAIEQPTGGMAEQQQHEEEKGPASLDKTLCEFDEEGDEDGEEAADMRTTTSTVRDDGRP